MDIKISILNEFNTEVSTYITDLDSYELLKKHNIPIQDKIDEMIHKVYFNQVSENNQTEDLVKIPNGDDFFTSEQETLKEGAELQQERMYSEEDMKKAFEDGKEDIDYSEACGFVSKLTTEEWFKKIKKK